MRSPEHCATSCTGPPGARRRQGVASGTPATIPGGRWTLPHPLSAGGLARMPSDETCHVQEVVDDQDRHQEQVATQHPQGHLDTPVQGHRPQSLSRVFHFWPVIERVDDGEAVGLMLISRGYHDCIPSYLSGLSSVAVAHVSGKTWGMRTWRASTNDKANKTTIIVQFTTLFQRLLTHCAPRRSWSFKSNCRKITAEGSITPARTWTPRITTWS